MPLQTLIIISYVINLTLIVWLVFLTYAHFSQKRFFQEFTQGVSKKDLKTILKSIAKSLNTVGTQINYIKDDIKQIKLQDKSHFQKIGFVRYNPFSDTGGDQSFCLCLLDDTDTGFTFDYSLELEQNFAVKIGGDFFLFLQQGF